MTTHNLLDVYYERKNWTLDTINVSVYQILNAAGDEISRYAIRGSSAIDVRLNYIAKMYEKESKAQEEDYIKELINDLPNIVIVTENDNTLLRNRSISKKKKKRFQLNNKKFVSKNSQKLPKKKYHNINQC